MTNYRTGNKLRTTIYRNGDTQPCVWVPADPELAERIVFLLNNFPESETPDTETTYKE